MVFEAITSRLPFQRNREFAKLIGGSDKHADLKLVRAELQSVEDAPILEQYQRLLNTAESLTEGVQFLHPNHELMTTGAIRPDRIIQNKNRFRAIFIDDAGMDFRSFKKMIRARLEELSNDGVGYVRVGSLSQNREIGIVDLDTKCLDARSSIQIKRLMNEAFLI